MRTSFYPLYSRENPIGILDWTVSDSLFTYEIKWPQEYEKIFLGILSRGSVVSLLEKRGQIGISSGYNVEDLGVFITTEGYPRGGWVAPLILSPEKNVDEMKK